MFRNFWNKNNKKYFQKVLKNIGNIFFFQISVFENFRKLFDFSIFFLSIFEKFSDFRNLKNENIFRNFSNFLFFLAKVPKYYSSSR